MRKVQIVAVFWTILIALPFILLAILLSAYLTENLIRISTEIVNLSRNISFFSRDLLFESQVLGLIAGVIIIITIMAITKRTTENQQNS